jgi:general secretion pathway protein I
MARPEPAGARGFTLLEVLVALIIFGIAFGVLAQVVQTGLRQSDVAATTTTAVLLARSQLARVGADVPLAPGALEGETEGGLRWHIGVLPAEIEPREDDLVLYLVEVTVAWGPIEQGQAITLTSLRLGYVEP